MGQEAEPFPGRETSGLGSEAAKAKVSLALGPWGEAAMAAGGAVRELSEELSCPICLEYFVEPVILPDCGHSFCRACLTRYWGDRGIKASCPVCKQPARARDLRPNRQLANVVEIAQKLSLQGGDAGKGDAPERLCGKHREPLKLFCRTDGSLLCMVCSVSKEHKSHEFLPAEEAAQEYQDKIFNCLETLRAEREKILVFLAVAEDESQEMLKITESEKKNIMGEFRTLHQFLEEQENSLLAQIEKMEKEIAKKRDDHLAKLSEELSSLESLIREMEEKQQQPQRDLLLDVRSSLQRCEEKENFENPVAFSSDLKWRLQACCDRGLFVESVMKQFKDTLVSERQMQKAKVTLDPTSAISKLIISEGGRSIKAEGRREDPGGDYIYSYVQACDGFTAGCHFWEIAVGSEDGWAVGVSRKHVKGRVTFTPDKGIWTVGLWKGQYQAFINTINPLLTLRGELKRIRVSLNYDAGQLAFFDANTAALLYKFSGVSFSGETLLPFFAVYNKGYIRLCP